MCASATPSGAVSVASPPISTSEGILMNPTLNGGVPTAVHPEMMKPITAGTARITPRAELVPTAVWIGAPKATSVGTVSEPPPIPISAEI